MRHTWDTQGLCNKHTHKIKYNLIVEMDQVNAFSPGERYYLRDSATMYNVLKPHTK